MNHPHHRQINNPDLENLIEDIKSYFYNALDKNNICYVKVDNSQLYDAEVYEFKIPSEFYTSEIFTLHVHTFVYRVVNDMIKKLIDEYKEVQNGAILFDSFCSGVYEIVSPWCIYGTYRTIKEKYKIVSIDHPLVTPLNNTIKHSIVTQPRFKNID